MPVDIHAAPLSAPSPFDPDEGPDLQGEADQEGANSYVPQTDVTFDSLPIPEPILRGLRDVGFRHCTPIQARSLPHTLLGDDVAGQAQTGTGKTAAFVITIFKELLETDRLHPSAPRAVVVAPTRELALQIAKDADELGRYCDFRTVAVFGGMDWEKQARHLEGVVDLVVGTPGRMMDYMRRKTLDLRHVQVVVIDEADRMFDMGFLPDIQYILSHCAADRQTMLFSATLSFDVMRLAQRYMRDVVEIRVEPEQVTARNVEQTLFHVSQRDKLRLLLWILEDNPPHRALIFVNTKRAGEWLQFKLFHNGWESEYMSGDIPQKKRMRLIEDFRGGKIEVLVATDVAARGLHVDDVDLVVNYDIPADAEDYVHRIGRTGRAGAKGRAVTLADEALVEHLPAIEKYIGNKIGSVLPTQDNFMDDLSPSFRDTVLSQRRGKSGPGRPRRH